MEVDNVFLVNLDSTELDTPVYRFISFENLLEIILFEKLTFAKTSAWDDPYENYFFKTKVNTTRGDFSPSLQEVQSRLYGQCWTLNPESDALWRIYSDNQRGIRIETTLRKIYDIVKIIESSDHSICIGKVKYNSLKEIEDSVLNFKYFTHIDTKFFYNTLLIKRNEFLHENEVRILYVAATILKSNFKEYSISINDFISSITFDPRINTRFEKLYCKALYKLGYKNELRKSDLYSFKRLDITIS